MILYVYVVLSFTFAFTSLAVSLHFLEHHEAGDLPLLWASISAPWALKPFLGLLVDCAWGRPRWICLGFVCGGISFALAPISHIWIIVGSTWVCLGDCAADALMVEMAREQEGLQRKTIGARALGTLLGTLLGGIVYTWGYGLVMRGVAVPLLSMGVGALDLPNLPRTCAYPTWSWKLVCLQVIGFLLAATPGADTFILLAWKKELSSITIALASLSGQVGVVLGLWFGKSLRRDLSIWMALTSGMLVSLSAGMTPWSPLFFAVVQNFVGGFGGALFSAPLIEKVSETVRGHEAFTFAACMASVNLGGIVSSALEAEIMKGAGIQSVEDDPLPLVGISVILGMISFPLGTWFARV